MDISKLIKDNCVIIVPQSKKLQIIRQISLLDKMYSYKILSDTELKKSVYFDYDITAISYLSNKYGLKCSVAKEYIENMYHLKDVKYKSVKLNELLLLKKELLSNNLLKNDFSFHSLIKDKNAIVFGFKTISKELLNTLDDAFSSYQIIKQEDKGYTPKLFCFETLQEEVDAIFYQISTLLKDGININKIKIANANEDYMFTLKRYSALYNVPLTLQSNTTLFSLICIKEFYKKCCECLSLKESLEFFKETYKDQMDVYSSLLSLCNELVLLDIKDNLHLLKHLLKNKKLPSKSYVNCVELVSLDDYEANDDEYIFALSINQSITPKTYKNEDFLSDSEKEELNLDTSEDLNVLSKNDFVKAISNIKNLTLSYKKKTSFASFNKAFVLNELKIEERTFKKDVTLSFSKKLDELSLASNYDKIYQKTDDVDVKILANNYNILYKNYSHKFKSFEPDKIKNYMLEKKKNLSYSALSNFYACSFRYYLSNILGVGKKFSNRSADIGTAFHKVLEDSFKKDFNFEESFKMELEKLNDVITKFYLEKFKLTLKEIIKLNKENLQLSNLKDVLTEKKVEVEYSYPFKMKFKGFVDKILYTKKDGKTYVAIIDYKTGNPEINIDKVDYGLSLQLPIYLYLLKHTKEFENVVVCGFYLQKLLPKQQTAGQDYIQTIKEAVALQGYSNSSLAIISQLDPTFSDSTFIKSLKLKKDGTFQRYSKVISSEEMDALANKVETKVIEALENIASCKFDINPKMLKGKNQSCAFCEFNECCFKQHSDLIYLDGIIEDEENTEMVGDNNGY